MNKKGNGGIMIMEVVSGIMRMQVVSGIMRIQVCWWDYENAGVGGII